MTWEVAKVIVPLVAAVFAASVLIGVMIIEDKRKRDVWIEERRRKREQQ